MNNFLSIIKNNFKELNTDEEIEIRYNEIIKIILREKEKAIKKYLDKHSCKHMKIYYTGSDELKRDFYNNIKKRYIWKCRYCGEKMLKDYSSYPAGIDYRNDKI